MHLVCANHSSYPRVGEGADAQRVRRAYAARERGEIDGAGYLDVCRDYAAEIMAEQAEAGCDLVTDGQVHHYDLVAHPSQNLTGTAPNGLLRFFDTNHLVRRPEITGLLAGTSGATEDWTAAAAAAPKPVKAVVTGPYTLARHSVLTDRAPYPDVASLAMAYAERLSDELSALSAAGGEWVQICEPSLLRDPSDSVVVRRALERATERKGRLRVSLATYFGPVTGVYDELLRMPVDMLGFDLSYDPGFADVLAERSSDRPVALGIVDGRNTFPDPVDERVRTVSRVAEALDRSGVDEVHLQPSCGLEYLPRDRAVRKLGLVREITDAVLRAGASA